MPIAQARDGKVATAGPFLELTPPACGWPTARTAASVTVMQSARGVDDAALAAVRQWQFRGATSETAVNVVVGFRQPVLIDAPPPAR